MSSLLIRAVANLELCVYYLKHMERVQRKLVVATIDLDLVRSYRDQQRHGLSFKKTVEDPVINEKDWSRTLETVKEYVASQYGGTGTTSESAVKPEAEDPADGYDTVDQYMTVQAPHT
jgi:hypothetical protein